MQLTGIARYGGMVLTMALIAAFIIAPAYGSNGGSPPKCIVQEAPTTISPGGSTSLNVLVVHGVSSTTYKGTASVSPGGGSAAYSIATNSGGSGAESMSYPSDFGGSTALTGTYTVTVTISASYAAPLTCTGTFTVH
jgi:hypothetical protein